MRVAEFLFNTLPYLIQFYANKYLQDDYTKTLNELENDLNVPRPKYFDFIVVGGGTAGCVVAGRLSEKFNVLLLEAGGTPPPAVDVPFFSKTVIKDPSVNSFFNFVPQQYALQRTGGNTTIPIGKMLGGSGSHNDMVHNRGSPKDYDNWAIITNDSSWTYANVLKYFARSENFIGKQLENEKIDFLGRGGPITIDTNVVPILPLWFDAGIELGFESVDADGIQREGFTPMLKAIGGGRRMSAYTEYIKPYETTRKTLTVIRYANVSEILLNESNQAVGVAYTRHGFPQLAYARKEIVVSAGAFASPLLLMKSGIGPVDTLRAANISVKVPLEQVGKNLGEHPAVVFMPFYVNDTSYFNRINPNKIEDWIQDFHETGESVLGRMTHGPQCFITSSKAEKGWPDIWIEIYPQVVIEPEPQVIFFNVVVGRAKSLGLISLNTTAYNAGIRDDVQLAQIDPKLLSHPDDMEVMLEAIKFTLQIAENTTAFKKLGMTYGGDPDPACKTHVFRSDDYWRCHIHQNTEPWIHMAGTCGIGPDNGDSVLDSKFRVRGVRGLRVVDGSAMPIVPNANTNAPILMLAEKASDDIINLWIHQSEIAVAYNE